MFLFTLLRTLIVFPPTWRGVATWTAFASASFILLNLFSDNCQLRSLAITRDFVDCVKPCVTATKSSYVAFSPLLTASRISPLMISKLVSSKSSASALSIIAMISWSAGSFCSAIFMIGRISASNISCASVLEILATSAMRGKVMWISSSRSLV